MAATVADAAATHILAPDDAGLSNAAPHIRTDSAGLSNAAPGAALHDIRWCCGAIVIARQPGCCSIVHA